MAKKKVKIHRNIYLLFFIRICRALCINLIWTTWPLFVQSLGANMYQISLVWALGGILNIFLIIPLSIFSDRFGRKMAILLSFSFTIISHLAYVFVSNWKQLIPLKMLADLQQILYFPAEAAMIADISISSNRGTMYGIVGVAHPIGSIIAPLLGGLILDYYGWNAVFYAIVFSAFIALLPSVLLTETRARKENKVKSRPVSFKNLRSSIDISFLYPMLIFSLFNFFSGMQMGLSQITPVYLKEKFNATNFQQGLFFSVGTMVPSLIIQLLGGWLADKYDRKKIIMTSIIFWPCLMTLWPSMDSYTSILLLRMLISLSNFSMPAKQAYLMDLTDDTRRGLASGVSMLGQRIGGTLIGTPLLGYLYENYGQTIPFYTAALFSLPSIPILMLLKEKNEKKT